MSAPDYATYRDWKGWTERPFGTCSPDQACYFAAELQRGGAENIDGRTVLEIGFGNGEFAWWARAQGAIYHGTEVIEELVAQGASAGFNTYDGRATLDSLFGKDSADLIVSFDVFEHLDAELLLETLRAAHRVLRPSGRLIVRVPSGDSPFSRAIQHGDSTHRVIVGSSMVRQLATHTGFIVDGVREPALPLRGLGFKVFLRRAMVVGLRTPVFAVMTRVFMGGGQPVLTPNLVFVLVKP